MWPSRVRRADSSWGAGPHSPWQDRVRPLPSTAYFCGRFRLCDFCPPRFCRRGDQCTFAHNNEELSAWNKARICTGSIHPHASLEPQASFEPKQIPWPELHMHTKPVSSNYKMKKSTFLDRVKQELTLEDIEQDLTALNYKQKFHMLLCWEEKEHITILHERCDGVYPLIVTGQKDTRKYGYLEVSSGDLIAYATQASEAVFLIDSGLEVKAEILRDNYTHTGNKMYISMDEECHLQKPCNIEAQFEVKHFFFDSLHNVINSISDEVLRRLFPKVEDFDQDVRAEGIKALSYIPIEYKDILHLDTENLLPYQVALTCKSGAPPVLISGAFGTGKTCFISLVAYCFLAEVDRTHVPAHIMICAHHQATADTIMRTYFGPVLRHRTSSFSAKVIRIISNKYSVFHNDDFCMTIDEFRKSWVKTADTQKLVIITTFLTSLRLKECFPRGFITHILIDEGAQAREPEAIAPLCLADRRTKIIIAGDPRQVGPGLLVLGEEARKYGLKVSLLERLWAHYKAIGEKSKYLQANLTHNYRCHHLILKFASDMFYKSTVQPSSVTYTIPTCHGFPYPLVFVCTGIEEIHSYDNSVNEKEANILMKILDQQLRNEGKRIKVCIMSSSRSQVTLLRQKNRMPNCVRVLPTFDIQGQEYDALYISTSECTYSDGETCNPTKSVCDLYVFNTAITRARSLIISFGNPYLLLSIEKCMNKKYNSCGHCWSQYMKMCILEDTLMIPSSVIGDLSLQSQFKQKLLATIDSVLSDGVPPNAGAHVPKPSKTQHQLTKPLSIPVSPLSKSSIDPAKQLSDATPPYTAGQEITSSSVQWKHKSLAHISTSNENKKCSQATFMAPSTETGQHGIMQKQNTAGCLPLTEFPTLQEAKHTKIKKRQRQQLMTENAIPEHTQYFQYFKHKLNEGIFKGPLTVDNYKERFHHLLCWEEKEHMEILRKRCDGSYNIKVLEHMPKKQWSGELWHTKEKYYGIISSVDENDALSYAKQASESAEIVFNHRKICVSIAPSAQSKGITVCFSKHDDYLEIKKRVAFSGAMKCKVTFELKHSYFNRQHEALKALQPHVIKKLLPSGRSRMNQKHVDINSCSLYLDNSGQMQALTGILRQHEDSSPVIIAGPFGTGKTRLLARAAYELIKQDWNHKVLICTHHQISADTFIDYFGSLMKQKKNKNMRFVRIAILQYNSRMKEKYPDHYIGVQRAALRNPQVIVSTLGLSHHLNIKGITHIIVDEAAQTRETEAIIPLQHATPKTRIILAGDHCQVGPDVLVLGEEARRHGLSTSLLERLHKHYSDSGEKSLSFSLLQNYRCHSGVLMLPSSLFYRSTLQCNIPDNMAHPIAPFPLVFVCSSIENIPSVNLIGTDETEARVLVREVHKYIYESWPEEWGKRGDPPGQVCIVTPSVTQKHLIVDKLKHKNTGVDVLKVYEIQGCEFTAVFIGTCETTDENGIPKNITKTIMNRYIFNTALTRARYLVVAVGNPLHLLDKEENLAKSDPENNCFPCWKEFIRRCIECKSFHLPKRVLTEKVKEFKDVLYQRVFSDGYESESMFNVVSNDSILSAYKKKFERIPECRNSKLRLTRVSGRLSWSMKDSLTEGQCISYTDTKNEDQVEVYDCKLNMISFSHGEAVPLDTSKRVIQVQGMGNIRGAFHEDIVKVVVFNDIPPPHCKGRVLSVIKKCHKESLVCKIHRYNSILFCPLDKRYPIISNLPKLSRDLLERKNKDCIVTELQSKDVVIFEPSSIIEGNIPEIKNVIPHTVAQDMLFVVKILLWNPKYRIPLGVAVYALPKACSEFHAERILKIEHNVNYENETEHETESVRVQSTQCMPGIETFVDTRAFTIDPDDATNLDDAISLHSKGDSYQLRVHVVNTTNEIAFKSELDKKAAARGISIYGGKQVMNMLPLKIRSKLSLNPYEIRDVITVGAEVLIDDEGLISIDQVVVKESKIRSCAKLSYKCAQEIIEGKEITSNEISQYIADYNKNHEQPNLQETLTILYKISVKLRTGRLGEISAQGYRMEDAMEQTSWQAHLMIEEMMIWANSVVANKILFAFPENALLRKQNAPNKEELAAASSDHTHTLGYSFSLSQFAQPLLAVQTHLIIPLTTMHTILQTIDAKHTTLLQNLLTDDSCFPQLTASCAHFRRIQQKAEYISAMSSTDATDYRHYDLNLLTYTHFTSPLRRYADIVVQRIMKSVMRQETCRYSHEDILNLCHCLNGTFQNARSFEKKIKALHLAVEYLQSSKLYEAVVTRNTKIDIELSFLNKELKVIPAQKKRFKIRHLRCDRKVLNSDSAVYEWKAKMISFDENPLFPYNYEDLTFFEEIITTDFKVALAGPHVAMTLFKELESGMLQSVMQSVEVSPIATTISPSNWKHIQRLIQHPSEKNLTQVKQILRNSEPKIAKPTVDVEKIESPVVISCIKCRLAVYDLVKVWMTWSTRESILSPQLQLLEITPFFRICLQHNAHPAECFSDTNLTNASKMHYTNLKEYVSLWEKVLLAEAAERSISDNRSGTFYNVKLIWEHLVDSNDIDAVHYEPREGMIYCQLPSVMEKSKPFLKVHVGDFICVRYGTAKYSTTRAVFHLVVTHSKDEQLHLKSVGKDNARISERMKQMIQTETCEMQVISMSPSYQRVYKALLNLLHPSQPISELVRVVARGTDDSRIQNLPSTQTVSLQPLQNDWKATKLWSTKHNMLNCSQREAMKLSLTKRFQLIQGPPGTGKSETGAHIAYVLAMSNRNRGLKECVLYCAPTNKAVDVVLRKLDLISSEINILRVYGKAVEGRDYPGPHCEKENFQVSESVYRCPERARKYALHWKIRNPNKELLDLEKMFQDKHKEGLIPGAEKCFEWKSLIDEAELTVLNEDFDIVLCTCNEAASKRITKKLLHGTVLGQARVLQCIVDESGMAYEPETIVPLSLCEHVVLLGDHKQLQPVIEHKPARENGLTTSLFERYAKSRKNTKMLDIQYRMHEAICKFPSDYFYDGKLNTDESVKRRINKETKLNFWPNGPNLPIMFCDFVGEEPEQRLSKFNPQEAEKVVEIVRVMHRVHEVKLTEIAIMTPYKAQRDYLKVLADKEGLLGPDGLAAVVTITESQGDEYGIVVLSTVRSQPLAEISNEDHIQPDRSWLLQNLGFLTDQHEINVGITRSKYGLIIVGNKTLLRFDVTWRALINHYEERKCVVDGTTFPNQDLNIC